MFDKPKRKRIVVDKGEPVHDHLQFTENKCSPNARQTHAFNYDSIVNVWIDKHYSIRLNLGEDNGAGRDGIDYANVEKIVMDSYQYLKYFALKNRTFIFLNFPPEKPIKLRVVLKKHFDNEETLNVVAEYHFVNFNDYEVTIVTAMRKDNFTISVGQNALEMYEARVDLVLNNNNNDEIIDYLDI